MLQDDALKAIPLWINGHAFLTVTPIFREVRNPINGVVLRRVPLCGYDEVQVAIAAAQAALGSWAGMPEKARVFLLSAVGDALAHYGAHFAALVSEESGKDSSLSDIEVDRSVALLRSAAAGNCTGVVAVIGDSTSPLLESLLFAVPALAAGATVVARPSPEVPSTLFALAELIGRCGLPDGVFNIVYGDDVAADILRASGDISAHFP